MKEKLKNFTLSSVVISGLLAVICVMLGFILTTFNSQVQETIGLRQEVNKFVLVQNNILSKQTAMMNEIKGLRSNDVEIFDQLDTFKISLADYKLGFINHEGRIYKLEKYHVKQ